MRISTISLIAPHHCLAFLFLLTPRLLFNSLKWLCYFPRLLSFICTDLKTQVKALWWIPTGSFLPLFQCFYKGSWDDQLTYQVEIPPPIELLALFRDFGGTLAIQRYRLKTCVSLDCGEAVFAAVWHLLHWCVFTRIQSFALLNSWGRCAAVCLKCGVSVTELKWQTHSSSWNSPIHVIKLLAFCVSSWLPSLCWQHKGFMTRVN